MDRAVILKHFLRQTIDACCRVQASDERRYLVKRPCVRERSSQVPASQENELNFLLSGCKLKLFTDHLSEWIKNDAAANFLLRFLISGPTLSEQEIIRGSSLIPYTLS